MPPANAKSSPSTSTSPLGGKIDEESGKSAVHIPKKNPQKEKKEERGRREKERKEKGKERWKLSLREKEREKPFLTTIIGVIASEKCIFIKLFVVNKKGTKWIDFYWHIWEISYWKTREISCWQTRLVKVLHIKFFMNIHLILTLLYNSYNFFSESFSYYVFFKCLLLTFSYHNKEPF